MSAKRRADGPAVRRKPPRAAGRSGTAKRRLRRVAKVLLALLLVGVLGAGVAFAALYTAIDIPDPNEDFESQTTNIYYSGGEQELGQFATQNRESIDYDDMPDTVKDAVVAAENRTFWTDRGIDPRGILRAAFSNAQGNDTQGASTITQQYVKILYLTQERSYDRKIREAILSLKLQRQIEKQEILEGYLNTIYFGRGAYGIQAAATAFFDKEAADLDLRESAVLASVINNPTRFDPANGKDNRRELRDRYRYVLAGMAETGAVTGDEAEQAARRLPRFPEIPAQSQYGGQRGHMLTLVREELLRIGFTDDQIDGGGLRVTTTFTPEAMAAAADGVQAQRPEGFDGGQLHVATASVEVGTGALRGFFGGHDYLESQINWAEAGGMAGSTMKAFTLAAAIRDGYSLRDTFDGNSPIELGGDVSFENQGNQSYGSAIDMLTATENSVNTAFVDMVDAMEDGPQKVIRAAGDLGIPGNESGAYGIPRSSIDLQDNVGVTLGTAQVSPINMANAYATIAAGGVRSPVHVVERVVDANGEERYAFGEQDDPAEQDEAVLDEDIAADVSFALEQVVESGSGTAALELDRPAAGKTGTATNDDDEVSSSWFVGYTPQMATAVMYVRGKGRDQLEGWLPEYFGGSYPARTWTDVMGRLMEGLPVEEFPEPAYVDGDAPDPDREPAPAPTVEPTQQPTAQPTRTRRPSPTSEPTETPSETPTLTPTPSPSLPPTTAPTPTPTPTLPPTTAPPPPPPTPEPTPTLTPAPPPSPTPPPTATPQPTASQAPPPSSPTPAVVARLDRMTLPRATYW